MSRFDVLTRYLSTIHPDRSGEWVADKENDGTPDHPIHMPYVRYSREVEAFEADLYKFCEAHPEYEHTSYSRTLEKSGLEWSTDSMRAADVSGFDAKSVIALMVGVVRAERFCNGALLDFFDNGCILRWLERLKAIDEGGMFNGNGKQSENP